MTNFYSSTNSSMRHLFSRVFNFENFFQSQNSRKLVLAKISENKVLDNLNIVLRKALLAQLCFGVGMFIAFEYFYLFMSGDRNAKKLPIFCS